MNTVLERPAALAETLQPTAGDRRRVDELIALARQRAAAPLDGPAFEAQVMRWVPIAVPGLAVLMCLSILAIWSIL